MSRPWPTLAALAFAAAFLPAAALGDFTTAVSFIRDASGNITTVAVPGATTTFAAAINDAGTVAGTYVSPTGNDGIFVRSAAGVYTTVPIPGFSTPFGYVAGINSSGVVAGQGTFNSGVRTGFVYSPATGVTTFSENDPGVSRILNVVGLNNAGTVLGETIFPNPGGFLRDSSGQFTKFSQPGGTQTEVFGINNAGSVVGKTDNYSNNANLISTNGFIRDAAGSYTSFTVPGAIFTNPYVINNLGTVVGLTFPRGGNEDLGFLRDPSGAITTFSLPSGSFSSLLRLNDAGVVAGTYDPRLINSPLSIYGFIRNPAGAFTSFDPSGGQTPPGFTVETHLGSLNDSGLVTGYYSIIPAVGVPEPSAAVLFACGAAALAVLGAMRNSLNRGHPAGPTQTA